MFRNIIPASKHAIVEKALMRVFNKSGVEDISLLTGGLSTALVYKITLGNRNYLLRLVMSVDTLNDPVRQYLCMGLAAEAGIAPKVYYTSNEDGLAITDFIDARPLGNAFSTPSELLSALAGVIRAIHALPLFPPLVDFLDGVDMFIQQFKTSGMFPETITAECFERYAEIRKHYPRHEMGAVSSHNDLNPNNILFDGKKIWIVDWEAAFRNDKYVDLAIIAKSFAADPKKEDHLLQSYFSRTPTGYERACFFIMKQVCSMYYAMVMLNLATASKPADYLHDANMNIPELADFYSDLTQKKIALETYEGKLLYGKTLLNEMLRSMKSTTFSQSMQLIRSDA